jgi:hypothetical protein
VKGSTRGGRVGLTAASKASEDGRTRRCDSGRFASRPDGRLHGQNNSTPSLTKGLIVDCAWARGSSAKGVGILRSDQKSFPGDGQRCWEADSGRHLLLVSLCGLYRVRRTTGSTATCKGRGNTAASVSRSQALSGGDSVQDSRRSHGSETLDCAVDCSVGVGTYRPDAKGVQSVQRDRHRAGHAIAAAPSVD